MCKYEKQKHSKFHPSTTATTWWLFFQRHAMPRYTCIIFHKRNYIMHAGWESALPLNNMPWNVCCTSHFMYVLGTPWTEILLDLFQLFLFKQCCEERPCVHFFPCFCRWFLALMGRIIFGSETPLRAMDPPLPNACMYSYASFRLWFFFFFTVVHKYAS